MRLIKSKLKAASEALNRAASAVEWAEYGHEAAVPRGYQCPKQQAAAMAEIECAKGLIEQAVEGK